ncbi:40S small subunit processome assembly factor 1 [Denticeps clupeoides]|uniref:Uncharacterized protein n=1 Tax=Denticeps clupeoides TaxID=299321 RepID=A0AAY4DKN2_9TELE|nr:uncharacterized protein C1orf131 homolog [Denticeps clupeoides]
MGRIKEDGEEGDADRTFLDQVLRGLYDFGDGEKNPDAKGEKRKRERGVDAAARAGRDDRGRPAACGVEEPPGPSSGPRVEVVVFQDPLKKGKDVQGTEAPEVKPPDAKKKRKKKKNNQEDEEFSIEKARLEVHRFGLTGFQKNQQRIFEQERAIMLGAQPLKREYVNYKEYQKSIKEKKQKEKEEAKLEQRKKKKKPTKERKEKRKPSSTSEHVGQMGRFKNGMLVLSSKDIQTINSKAKK